MTSHSISEKEHLLGEVALLDHSLAQQYQDKLKLDPSLSRTLVSFQADKTKPVLRWYKFKEAFSSFLVEYLLGRFNIVDGPILDPFAGSGTTLFAASEIGLRADGIELLPIGQEIIASKRLILSDLTSSDLDTLVHWSRNEPWRESKDHVPLNELRITQGAYPKETKKAIECYLGYCRQENHHVQVALHFALLCILESVSYTRKDGQYLRWDHRSGKRQGKKPFQKQTIVSFEDAISSKLYEIVSDLSPSRQPELFSHTERGQIELHCGSCLDILPSMQDNTYHAIFTSPPYCNRYDYTRTYALELALLGVAEQGLINLRQQMLSSTVENRTKDLLALNPNWINAITAANQQELLQTVLRYLEQQRESGELNNNGIPRMVRGYFYEMACVIAESFRVLQPGAFLLMVNDNVRYAGASISVDLILSDIAARLGFSVEDILILPNGKGNSSQQMGEYGREKLRKCVYVWRKPEQ